MHDPRAHSLLSSTSRWPLPALSALLLVAGLRCDCGAPCAASEERVDGRCLRPCNADRDCPAEQICVRGYCTLGNRLDPQRDAAVVDAGAVDARLADGAAPDTAGRDRPPADGTSADTPGTDASSSDTPAIDVATADRAATDGHGADVAPPDAAPLADSAAAPDTAATPDVAAAPDAAAAPDTTAALDTTAVPDSASPDTVTPDSAAADAASADAVTADVAVVDAGVQDGHGPCLQGELCDDGNANTSDDLCMLENLCRGIDFSGIGTCGDTCPGTCNPFECCADACTGDLCFCPQACSCDIRLRSTGGQQTTCYSESTCFLVGGGGLQDVTCEVNAACRLYCEAGSTCSMDCQGGAACLIHCDATATCNLLNCTSVDCGNGIQVCGRQCPP
ncbi:MAG: hypothetical protein ABIJ09_13220 [Pseudomonadota bacterium]